MADITWTASQQNAIRAIGQSVLVSAGAGSGKTAVLAERCAYLVSEAPDPCNVDELLVVTFTNAAAAEMRKRIRDALLMRLSASPNSARLKYQIAMLDAAHISTIHSFCRRVLNRFFAQADLDPAAPLLDAQDAHLLREQCVKQVFDDFARQDGEQGDAFLDFLAAYGGSSEKTLRGVVLAIDHYMTSLPDSKKWLTDSAKRMNGLDAPPPLEVGDGPSFWFRQLHETLLAEIQKQIRAVESQIGRWQKKSDVYEAFIDPLNGYFDALCSWRDPLLQHTDAKTMDRVCVDLIGSYCFPSIPDKRGRGYKDLIESDKALFDSAQGWLKNVREGLFKKRLLKNYGHFTMSDWAEGVARTAPHIQTLIKVLGAYHKQYESAKSDLGVVDFSDLERKTLNLLKDDSNGVAERLHREFKHVLVDEFQDVNPVQAEILRLVSDEAAVGRPGNLFIVGDVKQSIYRFRLAEPKLFLKRRSDYQWVADADPKAIAGRTIDMVDNFRSRRGVIEAINALFEKLMDPDLGGVDYDEHARLKCRRDDLDHPAARPAAATKLWHGRPSRVSTGETPVPQLSSEGEKIPGVSSTGAALELHVLEKPSQAAGRDATGGEESDAFDWERIEREAYVMAGRIKTLVEEGWEYKQIVILLRSMKKHIGLLVIRLTQLGVPVFADTSGSLFESLEVMDVLSLLALLDNQQQDIPLAAVLRSPLFGRPMTDTQLVELRKIAGNAGNALPFHAAVVRYANEGQDHALKTQLQMLLTQLRHWRNRMRRRPVAEVLWEIYEESGYLAYVSGLVDGRQRRANLLQLHEYARRFGTFQRQGCNRFLRFLDGLREAGVELDSGSVAAPSGNVVRIMTIHRSKGLEFPVVILGELGKQFNLADARGSILFDRHLGIGMKAVDVEQRITYPTLPHHLVSQAADAESRSEEMRVLYVALTRAKEKLILVGTGKLPEPTDQQTEEASPSAEPLPLIIRQNDMSLLDWVVGAVSAQPPGRVFWPGEPAAQVGEQTDTNNFTDPIFAIQTYTTDDMMNWQIEPAQPAHTSEKLLRLSQMQPVDQVAELDRSMSDLSLVQRRLTTPYPAEALTRVPAVVSASLLKRRWNALADEEQPAADWTVHDGMSSEHSKHRVHRTPLASQRRRPMSTPDFLDADQPDDPAQRGTWTHEVLQRLDLARACDQADLLRQLKEMTGTGVLSERQAQAINLEDIAWFFTTPLGQRVKNLSQNCGTGVSPVVHHRPEASATGGIGIGDKSSSTGSRLLREWPFVLGVDPTRYAPDAVGRSADDVMLVRGIIDLLFDDGDGWEILDYKTDRVSGDELPRRVEMYAGQLQIYSAAVEANWQRRPQRCWLVFLHSRTIRQMP